MKGSVSVIVLINIVALGAACGRVGDTQQQCNERYGVPYKSENGFAYYRKAGFFVVISFHEGKADCISYKKVEENALANAEDISENEIRQFLRINGGERTWKKQTVLSLDIQWTTEDGRLAAFYKPFDHYLTIYTKEWADRQTAAIKAKENKNLEGF
jgi:hypothetical protein